MVQPRDTWEQISSTLGSFVVKKPEKVLIASQIVSLDVLCGCYENVEIVTYKVKAGDTLFTICSRFNASVNKIAELNRLEDPGLIHDGDIILIPGPAGLQNLIMLDDIESEESVVSSFNSDKATVFPYREVCDATSNFSTSLKIGQGSYGSVYLGKLRGADAAIKQMKNTKCKEFLSELNILCKVHHTNLIKLIGYAAGGDSLFLVYEFAQNGALSDHLHKPALRGYKPLSWTTRVQIALDAAKGLEYIHVHTKPYYVHRDVKTSNILLDSNFRAKIADFGLVKLLEQSPEDGVAASRIVGTFGYLAPEYVRDGCVTTKSDVYAFGVVLMELLTGQPALSRDASPENDEYGEHRSVVDYMLSALHSKDDSFSQLFHCVDPNLMQYHKNSLFQMAILSKDCVDDDWTRRPDTCIVVLRLSLILARSKEWEKLDCSYPKSLTL